MDALLSPRARFCTSFHAWLARRAARRAMATYAGGRHCPGRRTTIASSYPPLQILECPFRPLPRHATQARCLCASSKTTFATPSFARASFHGAPHRSPPLSPPPSHDEPVDAARWRQAQRADDELGTIELLSRRHLFQAASSSALAAHLDEPEAACEPASRADETEALRASGRRPGGPAPSPPPPRPKRTIYSGVDPSAESLHLGNVLPLLALLHLARRGHSIVVVIGGATGSIGDPSGRSTERQSLSQRQLAHNVACITRQVHDFFESAARYDERRSAAGRTVESTADEARRLDVKVVNNLAWYEGVGVLDFLRTVGKHVRIGDMLARDSVKSRLQPAPSPPGQTSTTTAPPPGLSFTEFSYSLLQAYDFWTLHSRGAPWGRGCTVQLGGSDQMGNIMAGVDLIRRLRAASTAEKAAGAHDSRSTGATNSTAAPPAAAEAAPAYGLTLPLLLTSSGAKFGKSAGNAVWLDAARCSHLELYQHLLRTPDESLPTYLRCLTLLPLGVVEEVVARHAATLREEGEEAVGGAGAEARAEAGADAKREEDHDVVASGRKEKRAQDGARREGRQKENRKKKNWAQRVLAREVVELLRGPEAVARAEAESALLFGTRDEVLATAPSAVLDVFGDRQRRVGEGVMGTGDATNTTTAAAAGATSGVVLLRGARRDVIGRPLADLAYEAGIVASKGEARRLLKSGGVLLNNDEQLRGDAQARLEARMLLGRAGERDMRGDEVTNAGGQASSSTSATADTPTPSFAMLRFGRSAWCVVFAE